MLKRFVFHGRILRNFPYHTLGGKTSQSLRICGWNSKPKMINVYPKRNKNNKRKREMNAEKCQIFVRTFVDVTSMVIPTTSQMLKTSRTLQTFPYHALVKHSEKWNTLQKYFGSKTVNVWIRFCFSSLNCHLLTAFQEMIFLAPFQW